MKTHTELFVNTQTENCRLHGTELTSSDPQPEPVRAANSTD